MNIELDDWQKKVLETEGNICLRSGRQVGKSTIISIKAGEYALKNKKKSVMVIASVERQAQLLFEKILAYIYENAKTMIKTGKDRPTKHKINLKNGSVIHCLPTGESGYGIRGFTIDLLIADEAAFINEGVWTAVTPMLAVTKGDMWLLSTPHGREGFYYRCFSDDKFTSFHVSSEDCPRKDEAFLQHEKEWMTKAQYAQEYLGEFVDELQQFFPDELIKKICILSGTSKEAGFTHLSPVHCRRDLFLGVDIARLGEDETTFIIIDGTEKNKIIQRDLIIEKKLLTTQTARRIIWLEKHHKFNKIGIDDGGVGAGVLDILLEDNATKRKTIALNNAKRQIDREGKRKKRLLKEDMYNNLLRLMERNEIKLFDDENLKASLKSIQYEYTDENMKIYGRYSHIVEGLIRACWCVKAKNLKPFVHCF